jgi:hypothetical protein
MACDRNINPQLAGFKEPELKNMDVWKNRELLKEVENYLYNGAHGYPEKDLLGWEKMLKSRIKKNNVRLLFGKVDIDNDGADDSVLYYTDGRCGKTKFYGTPIFVLNKKLASIDKEKTLYLMQNPSLIGDHDSGGWAYTMYDVFTHKGVSYFDLWSDSTHELNVYLLKNNNVKKICEYDFPEHG